MSPCIVAAFECSGQNLQLLEDFLEKEGVVANHAWFYSQIPEIPRDSQIVVLANRCSKSIKSIWCTDEATRLENARLINATKKQRCAKSQDHQNRCSMIVLQFLRWKGTRPFVLERAVQCQSPMSVGSHRTVGLVPWVGGWRHWRPGRPCVLTMVHKETENSQIADAWRQSVGNSLQQFHLAHFSTNPPPRPRPLGRFFKLIHWSHLLVVSIMRAMVKSWTFKICM